MRARFFLRQDTVSMILDRNHLTHKRFADHLGLSAAYWSQLYNGHRAVTPMVREVLVASRYLRGVDKAELWDVQSAAEAA